MDDDGWADAPRTHAHAHALAVLHPLVRMTDGRGGDGTGTLMRHLTHGTCEPTRSDSRDVYNCASYTVCTNTRPNKITTNMRNNSTNMRRKKTHAYVYIQVPMCHSVRK